MFSYKFWEIFQISFISPYSVRMRENADQNNSEYGDFLLSDSYFTWKQIFPIIVSDY